MDTWGPDPDDDASGPADASAVRPFLSRPSGAVPDPGRGAPLAPVPSAPGARSPQVGSGVQATQAGSGVQATQAGPAGGVRPYFLTRGRVASADGRVRVETVVVARRNATFHVAGPAFEHRRLLGLAARPTSVVELAVAMAVPVGVVLVLVGDLAGDGLLDISVPAVAPSDDVDLIRRLIDRVGAL
jgi:hypothetical protein